MEVLQRSAKFICYLYNIFSPISNSSGTKGQLQCNLGISLRYSRSTSRTKPFRLLFLYLFLFRIYPFKSTIEELAQSFRLFVSNYIIRFHNFQFKSTSNLKDMLIPFITNSVISQGTIKLFFAWQFFFEDNLKKNET